MSIVAETLAKLLIETRDERDRLAERLQAADREIEELRDDLRKAHNKIATFENITFVCNGLPCKPEGTQEGEMKFS